MANAVEQQASVTPGGTYWTWKEYIMDKFPVDISCLCICIFFSACVCVCVCVCFLCVYGPCCLIQMNEWINEDEQLQATLR